MRWPNFSSDLTWNCPNEELITLDSTRLGIPIRHDNLAALGQADDQCLLTTSGPRAQALVNIAVSLASQKKTEECPLQNQAAENQPKTSEELQSRPYPCLYLHPSGWDHCPAICRGYPFRHSQILPPHLQLPCLTCQNIGSLQVIVFSPKFGFGEQPQDTSIHFRQDRVHILLPSPLCSPHPHII